MLIAYPLFLEGRECCTYRFCYCITYFLKIVGWGAVICFSGFAYKEGNSPKFVSDISNRLGA